MTMDQLIALLPMKGHSERVPNKNIREFCGQPLYHAVMKSLLGSPYIKEVVINTDSEIIAKDAKANFLNSIINIMFFFFFVCVFLVSYVYILAFDFWEKALFFSV